MLRKFLFSLLACFPFINLDACTGIIQKAENGEWVYARTMEFGKDLISFNLMFIPRGIAYTSQMPNGEPAAKWTTKYAHVGFNPFNMPIVADGLNEKGLACGGFYFPGWAKYQDVTLDESSKTISNLDFISWVLGNFATVDEVREALKEVKVAGAVFKDWGIIPPLHYIVADERGNRAVIEYVDGHLKIYEAALGTLTNSPTYDWHTVNARNYIGLSALNHPAIKVDGQELAQFGQGSGAIGLPGDFTPPSRFIRATFLNQVTLPGKDALEQVRRAFTILNQFDIPEGAVKDVSDGKTTYENTQWTSAADLTNRRYFFHTFTNRVIRSVDLKTLPLNAPAIQSIAVDTPEQIVDLSDEFKRKPPK